MKTIARIAGLAVLLAASPFAYGAAAYDSFCGWEGPDAACDVKSGSDRMLIVFGQEEGDDNLDAHEGTAAIDTSSPVSMTELDAESRGTNSHMESFWADPGSKTGSVTIDTDRDDAWHFVGVVLTGVDNTVAPKDSCDLPFSGTTNPTCSVTVAVGDVVLAVAETESNSNVTSWDESMTDRFTVTGNSPAMRFKGGSKVITTAGTFSYGPNFDANEAGVLNVIVVAAAGSGDPALTCPSSVVYGGSGTCTTVDPLGSAAGFFHFDNGDVVAGSDGTTTALTLNTHPDMFRPADTVMQFGDNSGNDEWRGWFDPAFDKHRVTIELGVRYVLSMAVRRSAGTGTLHGGLQGFEDDGAGGYDYVNQSGADDAGNHFHFAWDDIDPADTNWVEVRDVYFWNDGSSYSATGGTYADPKNLHPDVDYVTPLFRFNRANQAGTYEAAYVKIVREDTGEVVFNYEFEDTVANFNAETDTNYAPGTDLAKAAKSGDPLSYEYPQVAYECSGGSDTDVSNHTITVCPEAMEGDLLFVFMGGNNGPAFTMPTTIGTWLELFQVEETTGSTVSCAGFKKRAEIGDAGTPLNMTTDSSDKVEWHMVGLRNTSNALAEITGTTTTSPSNGGNPDPPNHIAAYGIGNHRWMTGYCMDQENAQPTVYPTGYTDNQYGGTSEEDFGLSIGFATKAATASSDNPGAFTVIPGNNDVTFTISVRQSPGLLTKTNIDTAYPVKICVDQAGTDCSDDNDTLTADGPSAPNANSGEFSVDYASFAGDHVCTGATAISAGDNYLARWLGVGDEGEVGPGCSPAIDECGSDGLCKVLVYWFDESLGTPAWQTGITTSFIDENAPATLSNPSCVEAGLVFDCQVEVSDLGGDTYWKRTLGAPATAEEVYASSDIQPVGGANPVEFNGLAIPGAGFYFITIGHKNGFGNEADVVSVLVVVSGPGVSPSLCESDYRPQARPQWRPQARAHACELEVQE